MAPMLLDTWKHACVGGVNARAQAAGAVGRQNSCPKTMPAQHRIVQFCAVVSMKVGDCAQLQCLGSMNLAHSHARTHTAQHTVTWERAVCVAAAPPAATLLHPLAVAAQCPGPDSGHGSGTCKCCASGWGAAAEAPGRSLHLSCQQPPPSHCAASPRHYRGAVKRRLGIAPLLAWAACMYAAEPCVRTDACMQQNHAWATCMYAAEPCVRTAFKRMSYSSRKCAHSGYRFSVHQDLLYMLPWRLPHSNFIH
eukprot:812813-Pelagomonas_calceolata.AAC.5